MESEYSQNSEEIQKIYPDPVAELARARFKIDHLAPLQRFVIANILDADTENLLPYRQLVLFPTGFGKSVCFQLPSLILEGLTVVVYPLLALMNDQKRRLDEAGIPCALFRGGLAEDEWRAQEMAVSSRNARIVIANPEILATSRLRQFLRQFNIAHFVIDEAHCIREWGETFRPTYLSLGESAELLAPRIVSAFTATAGPDIVSSIEERLFRGTAYRLVTSEADRPNIHYAVVQTLSPTRTLRRLLSSCQKPAIIFERSRPGTRMKAEFLRSAGFAATRFYHAGLSRTERNEIESWFQKSENAVLVSTNAYGLGVDKKNIRTVIHTGLPDSAEAYIQEAGRGGRDGKASFAVLIHNMAERAGPLGSSLPLQEQRKARFIPYPLIETCRREFLLHLLGETETPVCGACDNCERAMKAEHSFGSDGSLPWRRDLVDSRQSMHLGMLAHWRLLLQAEGFLETLLSIAANQKRWTMSECIRMLGPNGIGRGNYTGGLYGWNRMEREEMLSSLLTLGIIEIPGRGIWKDRICLSPKGHAFLSAFERVSARSPRHSRRMELEV
jgi:ATP-dependent DNA helicase RecQ